MTGPSEGAHRPRSAAALGPGQMPQDGWEISLTVPASSANLGPGFDSIGMALGVWDRAQLKIGGNGLSVIPMGQGSADVPRDETHLVVQTMHDTWAALGIKAPTAFELTYDGAIPHSRGMGSSASAIVAGVALATASCGYDLSDGGVLAFVSDMASHIEGHPDNASASVYGGVTVSWWADDAGQWRSVQLAPHAEVVPIVIIPDVKLSTHAARAALPTSVPLAVAARNSGRSALLSHALTARPDLLWSATVDYLHQEPRREAYPDSMRLVDELRGQGLPACISGAGPTVLTLGKAEDEAVVRCIAAGREVRVLNVPMQGVEVVSTSSPLNSRSYV